MSCSEYYSDHDQDGSISFSNGELSSCAYSYQIDSYGCVELSKEQTRRIYLAMKQYYEKEQDH